MKMILLFVLVVVVAGVIGGLIGIGFVKAAYALLPKPLAVLLCGIGFVVWFHWIIKDAVADGVAKGLKKGGTQ